MDEFESNTYTPNERRDILYRYMLENTNKDHAISKERILDFLGTRNIKISRNTLFEDFEFIEATYDVEIKYDKGKNGYFIVSTPVFEEYELHLIFDSLKAAQFIMPDTKATLISKLLHFTDKYSRKTILNDINAKPFTQAHLSNLDIIYEAIREDCKIGFTYQPLYYRHERAYEQIVVSPYAVISDGNRHLLFAHHEPEHKDEVNEEEDFKEFIASEIELLKFLQEYGEIEDAEKLENALSDPRAFYERRRNELKSPSNYFVRGETVFPYIVENMKNISILHGDKRYISGEAIIYSELVRGLDNQEWYAPNNLRDIFCRFVDIPFEGIVEIPSE